MRVAIIGGGTIAEKMTTEILQRIERALEARFGTAIPVAAGQAGTFAWQIFDAKGEHLLRGEYGIRHAVSALIGNVVQYVAQQPKAA